MQISDAHKKSSDVRNWESRNAHLFGSEEIAGAPMEFGRILLDMRQETEAVRLNEDMNAGAKQRRIQEAGKTALTHLEDMHGRFVAKLAEVQATLDDVINDDVRNVNEQIRDELRLLRGQFTLFRVLDTLSNDDLPRSLLALVADAAAQKDLTTLQLILTDVPPYLTGRNLAGITPAVLTRAQEAWDSLQRPLFRAARELQQQLAVGVPRVEGAYRMARQMAIEQQGTLTSLVANFLPAFEEGVIINLNVDGKSPIVATGQAVVNVDAVS